MSPEKQTAPGVRYVSTFQVHPLRNNKCYHVLFSMRHLDREERRVSVRQAFHKHTFTKLQKLRLLVYMRNINETFED